MSDSPTTQQVQEAVHRFTYLIQEMAKRFANETAVNREDFSLETLDFMSAANAALLRSAVEKRESLREGYVKQAMKNSILNARRSGSKHDPEQIDVEANFLDFYNAYLGGIGKPDSAQRRSIAEGIWLDLKPERNEKECDHLRRVTTDDRVASNIGRLLLVKLLWKRKLEYLPVPYRVDFDAPVGEQSEESNLTLADIVPAADPSKDGSYDAMEISSIDRRIKHFSNRRFVDNSKMVRAINRLVRLYVRKLEADITDYVSMRSAWRLTLLYLLSVPSPELQKRGYEPGTTIKDVMIIPDLVHLCYLADFDLKTAVKMQPIEAKTFFNRAKRQLGI